MVNALRAVTGQGGEPAFLLVVSLSASCQSTAERMAVTGPPTRPSQWEHRLVNRMVVSVILAADSTKEGVQIGGISRGSCTSTGDPRST